MPNLKYQKVNQNQGNSVEEDEERGEVAEESKRLTSEMDPSMPSRNPQGSQDEIDGGIIATNFPSTHSSQQLVAQDNDSVFDEDPQIADSRSSRLEISANSSGFSSISSKEWFAVIVLCFINLINYMDRFTIAGVLTDIQNHFRIGDDEGGLLQTAFVLSYMVFAPIFGYLGDRYSRKHIMAFGITLWSATTLLGSFMHSFGWFITFRALVGIGEASYSTIAPTLISDMFIHDMRSKMLALFYFAIPVGSGLGYIAGSETAKFFGSWEWALRVTPVLGLIAVILIMMIREPERGQSEGSAHMESTSYWEDVKDIVRNKSFMMSTIGFTCVAYVSGALAWWGPKFMHLGLQLQPGNEAVQLSDVSYKFGITAMVAGLMGVPLGSFAAQRLRPINSEVDPLICAFGLISSAPFVYLGLVVARYSAPWCFFVVFMAQVTLNLTWSLVADILLSVVVPTRRSTAEAFQILISHAFGDAGSPYLVGLISEALKPGLRTDSLTGPTVAPLTVMSQLAENVTTTIAPFAPFSASNDTVEVQFKALQYSLFQTSFVEILGGVFFLITALYILRDRTNVERAVAECNTENRAEPKHQYDNTTQEID